MFWRAVCGASKHKPKISFLIQRVDFYLKVFNAGRKNCFYFIQAEYLSTGVPLQDSPVDNVWDFIFRR